MNKAQLIDQVKENGEFTSAQAKVAVDSVLKSIEQALVDGERVEIKGFGNFETLDRPARNGRNPATGETIAIAATRVVKFRVGSVLKSAVA
jgi:DNA-binding protein HU-beta